MANVVLRDEIAVDVFVSVLGRLCALLLLLDAYCSLVTVELQIKFRASLQRLVPATHTREHINVRAHTYVHENIYRHHGVMDRRIFERKKLDTTLFAAI